MGEIQRWGSVGESNARRFASDDVLQSWNLAKRERFVVPAADKASTGPSRFIRTYLS